MADETNQQPSTENKTQDLSAAIEKALTDIKTQFDGIVKDLDDEEKKKATETFTAKVTEKINNSYKDNEELLKQATEIFNKLMSAQGETAETTETKSDDTSANDAVSSDEEDPWTNSKDEWLRGQREKLSKWF